VGITFAPWFPLTYYGFLPVLLLPVFFTHDCGHRSFAKRRWVNDLVGHLFMLPLIYPFHCWRVQHNHHHTHTNKLEDNAWHPISPQEFESWGPIFRIELWGSCGIGYGGRLNHPLGCQHFNWSNFREKNQSSVKLSVSVVVILPRSPFPTLIATTGIWGFVKFWLMPWLVYHFWMSTFSSFTTRLQRFLFIHLTSGMLLQLNYLALFTVSTLG